MHRLFLILPLLLTGCSPVSEVTQPRFLFGTRADPQDAVDLAQLSYPAESQIGPDLDIIVIKRGNTLSLVNRTTNAMSDLYLWLNKQYVARIEELPIGESTTIVLDNAINKYGEAFPVGGLLNPDKSYPVVLAELYSGSTAAATGIRHKIVVRSED